MDARDKDKSEVIEKNALRETKQQTRQRLRTTTLANTVKLTELSRFLIMISFSFHVSTKTHFPVQYVENNFTRKDYIYEP